MSDLDHRLAEAMGLEVCSGGVGLIYKTKYDSWRRWNPSQDIVLCFCEVVPFMVDNEHGGLHLSHFEQTMMKKEHWVAYFGGLARIMQYGDEAGAPSEAIVYAALSALDARAEELSRERTKSDRSSSGGVVE